MFCVSGKEDGINGWMAWLSCDRVVLATNHKTLYYQERTSAVRDSIFRLQKVNRISSLQFDYDLKKKELQIEALRQEQIRQKQQLTSQTLQRYALFIGLVYWLGWFLWYAGKD